MSTSLLLPVRYLAPESYEEILTVFREQGIDQTPILRTTPYGDLVCYLKEEIYMHHWDHCGTTYYYPISLGYFPIPVYFRPNPDPML